MSWLIAVRASLTLRSSLFWLSVTLLAVSLITRDLEDWEQHGPSLARATHGPALMVVRVAAWHELRGRIPLGKMCSELD